MIARPQAPHLLVRRETDLPNVLAQQTATEIVRHVQQVQQDLVTVRPARQGLASETVVLALKAVGLVIVAQGPPAISATVAQDRLAPPVRPVASVIGVQGQVVQRVDLGIVPQGLRVHPGLFRAVRAHRAVLALVLHDSALEETLLPVPLRHWFQKTAALRPRQSAHAHAVSWTWMVPSAVVPRAVLSLQKPSAHHALAMAKTVDV